MSAYCSYCGGPHPVTLCPSTYCGSSALASLHCSYCGSDRHAVEYCQSTAAGEGNRRRDPDGTFLD